MVEELAGGDDAKGFGEQLSRRRRLLPPEAFAGRADRATDRMGFKRFAQQAPLKRSQQLYRNIERLGRSVVAIGFGARARARSQEDNDATNAQTL